MRSGSAPTRSRHALWSVVGVACIALAALASPTRATAYTITDVNTAIVSGVAYLDNQQQADGHFGSSFPVAETGLAIVAYGVLDGGVFPNNLSPSYQAHLKSAVSWLLSNQDPTSGAWPSQGLATYNTGIALEALSLSIGVDPAVPDAISKGRSWLIAHQNAPPEVTGNPASPNCTGADGSGTESYCGGWNYDADFGRSDESNTGFALTGLALTGGVPAASATINLMWQRHVQALTATNPIAVRNDGGGAYQPGYTTGVYSSNANDTGSLIFGFGYDGLPASNLKAQAAIVFSEDVIDEYELMKATVRSMIYHSGQEEDGTCVIGTAGCTWGVVGDGGYHYSIWALTKGLGQYILPDLLLTDPTNWYDKVVDLLLSEQASNGSWPQDGRDDGTTIGATSFAVSALALIGVKKSDLSITKTDAPDPVTVGDTLTYTLSVKNGGPDDDTGVTAADHLPAGVDFVSASASVGSCSQASGTVTCTLGDLANGAVATAEIKVIPRNPGTITNRASVSGGEADPDDSNNTASQDTTVRLASISLTPLQATNPVGTSHTLTATVTDLPVQPRGKIYLTGEDPDFHAYQGGNAAGAQHVLQRAVAFVTGGKVAPRILLVTDLRDPGGGYSESGLGLQAAGFMGFDIADYGSGASGILDLRTVRFENYDAVVVASAFGGWLRQEELDILNSRAAGLRAYTGAGGGLVALAEGNHVTTHGQFGFLPCLQSIPVDEIGEQITAAGVRLGLTFGDLQGNQFHNVFPDACGMTVIDRDNAGNIVTLARTPSVTGRSPKTGPPRPNVLVTFDLTGANLGAHGVCHPADCRTDANGQVSFTYTGTTAGQDHIVACFTQAAHRTCSAQATKTWILVDADLSLAKTAPALVQNESNMTYQLTVSNAGPADAAHVRVTDPLPPGTTFVSASAGCSGTATVVCTLASLGAGGTHQFSITVHVDTPAEAVTDTATTSADQPDPNLGGNTASATTQVNHPPTCTSLRINGPSMWPPNHKLRRFTVAGGTDPDANPVVTSITGVRQDEPVNGGGDGNTSPDAIIIGPTTVDLRGERAGHGNGRVYYVAVTADDQRGGSCAATREVGVPHDHGKNGGPVGEGPIYDSTLP